MTIDLLELSQLVSVLGLEMDATLKRLEKITIKLWTALFGFLNSTNNGERFRSPLLFFKSVIYLLDNLNRIF